MNIREDKTEFIRQLEIIKTRKMPWTWATLVQYQLKPDLRDEAEIKRFRLRIYNVKRGLVIDWDVLKVMGKLADYIVNEPNSIS